MAQITTGLVSNPTTHYSFSYDSLLQRTASQSSGPGASTYECPDPSMRSRFQLDVWAVRKPVGWITVFLAPFKSRSTAVARPGRSAAATSR